jgi:hypothetical protein
VRLVGGQQVALRAEQVAPREQPASLVMRSQQMQPGTPQVPLGGQPLRTGTPQLSRRTACGLQVLTSWLSH